MTYTELLFVVAGFACCLLIGFGGGLYLGRRLLQAELDRWEAWYAQHMPRCASLEQSNQRGREALAEWEQAQ